MRKYLLLFILAASFSTAYARSFDERIADAMNRSDWFALDSIYSTAIPTDSVTPFLDVFARGLLGNRFNRPDISIPAFSCLLNEHSSDLDLGNLLSVAMMMSTDLSRIGENAEASTLLTSIYDATHEYLDSTWNEAINNRIKLYGALSEFKPYDISFDKGSDGKIPFRIESVGPADKNSVLMHLENSSINGIPADITFDTGAGVNVISDSLARVYDLIPLEAPSTVAGVALQSGTHAIAKELKIGNITLTDVPFSVMNITTGNEEADKYIDQFMIVIGSEVMLNLKDLTFDFSAKEITIPATAPEKSENAPNMCFSSGMNLLAKGSILGNRMLMCIDTGDASFGSMNNKFLERNKDYILTHAKLDTIRNAGIGGVYITQAYQVPDLPLELGGGRTVIPEMAVGLHENPANMLDYECNLGLRSLMLFGKVRFNMVDFTLSTWLPRVSATNTLTTAIAPIKFPGLKKPSDLQTIGFVALSIANGLLNVNAPTPPDL